MDFKVVDPVSRDVPRNSLGQRVTIADFDIAVTSPDGKSAAAQYLDAFNVRVCGCQGAVSGTVATVTATYPATKLEESARVSGVEFQKTATFTLKEPQGSFNPKECTALASNPGPRTPPTLNAAGRSAQRTRDITTPTLSLSGTNATGATTSRVLNPARTAVRDITTKTLILAGQK